MAGIRFVPTGIHGIFDYVGGITLIAAPYIFQFSSDGYGSPQVIIPTVLGVGLILYSLLTNYERGIPGIRFIPMAVHLILDFVASAFLAASPFLFGFYTKTPSVWFPHLIAGVGVILLVLVSQVKTRMGTAVTA